MLEMEEWVPSWLAKRANIGKYVEHPNQKSSKVLSSSQSYRILSLHFKAVTFFSVISVWSVASYLLIILRKELHCLTSQTDFASSLYTSIAL